VNHKETNSNTREYIRFQKLAEVLSLINIERNSKARKMLASYKL